MHLAKGGMFTVSDDCHGIDQIGANYDQLVQFAADIGIETLWYLKKSPTLNSSFSTISMTDFNDHEFFR